MDGALNTPADPPVGPPARARPARLLDNLWIAASSSQLTTALAVLLAFTFVIAALLPQLPAGLDPLAAGRWLSTVAARYGRFGPFLSSSGLFNVLVGPWVITLLAVSAFHLALRSVNQLRRLVARPLTLPPAPQGLPFELVHLALPVADIELTVRSLVAAAERGALNTQLAAPRPRVDAYWERRRWASAGPLLSYLGPLLIVLGLLGNTIGGWRSTEVALTPGRAVQPAPAGGLALSLVAPGSPNGRTPGVLALTRGMQTRYAWLGDARPAVWGDVWVTQRSSGPALAVQASVDGKPVTLQSIQAESAPVESLHLRFGQNESEQAFSIPSRGLAFRVVSYESLVDRGLDRPVFLLEGYQGANQTPGLNELVEDRSEIAWQGVLLTLQREAYVVVDLAGMPGLPLLALGGFLLLAGVIFMGWGGFTRTWVNVAAERDGALAAVRVAAPALGQVQVTRIAAALVVPEGFATLEARRIRPFMVDAALVFSGAFLFTALAVLALRTSNITGPLPQTWIAAAHFALAAVGLGALALGAARSLWFAVRGNLTSEMLDANLPAHAQGIRGRAGDPGRAPILAAFPLLNLAVLLGSVWSLFAAAAPFRSLATEMWLLATWLLVAAYLHLTSGWRPLRAPAWVAVVLVMAALAAGLAASLAASSLVMV